ncbi:MAG: universal stress protein [Betaproteobacteria bacterium HGW-Betaproteobacteria-20]|jgi:nucleotide-binding universal stress UspA family protein|nr:MAG: universal stress protein [Betaproteobacteria bacterium HGW-Betaproteobacteria-20]
MYKRILCPVDGSASSNSGMLEAIRLAKDQKAKLRFLYVVDTYFPVLDATGDFNVVYIDDILRKNGKSVLQNAEAAAIKAGVAADTQMVEAIGARVSEFVVKQAEEWPADLIVIGTHGLRGIERLVMGSDAETVLRTSPVPVLMVRNTHAAEKKQ